MKLRQLLACILTALLLCSCSAPAAQTPVAEEGNAQAEIPSDALSVSIPEEALSQPQQTEAEAPAPAEAPPAEEVFDGKPTIGFIIPDDESLLTRCAMHGFLRTAENLNYPARLYALSPMDNALDVVGQAVSDGCSGLLIWADDPKLEEASRAAAETGLPVVIPYASTTLESTGAQAILSPDPADFCTEAVRIMCEETIGRGNTAGVLAVVRMPGAQQEIFDAFSAAVAASYPQFTVAEQLLTGDAAADEEAARVFIKEHADISGILSLSPGGATAWYEGEIVAEKELKKEITSTPKPVNGVKQKDPRTRTPVIMSLDYTEENIDLVEDGKIYALIARPFYAAAAQSAMVLDSILHDASVQQLTRVNAPVIRKKDIEKYAAIVNEVKEWFGM